MKPPPFKIILSICTSGNVKRPDLISEFVKVQTENENVYDVYFHAWYGYMIKGFSDGFVLVYIPLLEKVIRWW